MDQQPKPGLSRSSSRKKRSTTNLTNLRLAPLSSKYADSPKDRAPAAKSPYDESQTSENYFARQHPSYLSGKSAPSTPSILSRHASRTHLGGGLSRRGSLYDDEKENETEYAYAAVKDDFNTRAEVGSGQIPKAKSEGLLLGKHSKSRSIGGASSAKKKHHSRRATGEVKADDEDWFTRTGAATNAMLQESKGQSWLASRESSAALVVDTTDDDEGYEEAAALSAWSSSASKLRSADPSFSPTASRSASRWGSRYGSRPASRKTSRRGSVTSVRTPVANPSNAPDYFSHVAASTFDEGELTSPLAERKFDEEEVTRLTSRESFGLGGIVDRFMGFSIFPTEEKSSATEDEGEARENETQEEAAARRLAENKRKKAEKEKLVAPRPTAEETTVQAEGGWSDAAWLLSVASKAFF